MLLMMVIVVVIVATSITYILYSNINNHDGIMFLFDEQRLQNEGKNDKYFIHTDLT
jgi:hypothetical protein